MSTDSATATTGDRPPLSNPAAAGEPPYPSPAYAWYVVGVLMIIYVVSFVDRLVVNLLVEPIKADLQVSDTQIGLLTGLSFALLYTILGLPAGWLADRKSRRGIIAAGVFVWSLMATLCGFAKNYWQLILARSGVGVGEAALGPAAYSLLPDYFPPEKLGRAFSIYGMGITIGSGLAFVIGGFVAGFAMTAGDIHLPLIGEVRPWQFVFIVTGLPGIPLALLMFTVKEPYRRGRKAKHQLPISEVVRFVSDRAALFGPYFVGCGLLSLVGYGTAAWLPATVIRTFQVPVSEVGYWMGGITMVLATAGLFAMGMLTDRMTRAGIIDSPVRVCLWLALVKTVVVTAVPLMPTVSLLWAMACVSGFIGTSWAGVAAAGVNLVTPAAMRAQVSAAYLFVVNIIGLGFGPPLVGFVTDTVFGDPSMVRYSLALVSAVCLPLAALMFAIALPRFRALRAG